MSKKVSIRECCNVKYNNEEKKKEKKNTKDMTGKKMCPVLSEVFCLDSPNY